MERKTKRPYRVRKVNGLDPARSAWGWLTSALAAKIAQKAYKTASWACRGVDVAPAEFLRTWHEHCALLAAQEAIRAGVEGVPSSPVVCLEEPPSDWRPQYPFHREPEALALASSRRRALSARRQARLDAEAVQAVQRVKADPLNAAFMVWGGMGAVAPMDTKVSARN